VLRLLARRGIDIGGADPTAAADDPVAEESPLLAGLSSAAVQGRIALGPRAGARVQQIGRHPDAPWVILSGPRQAHHDGFDLHANLAVRADDRAVLERLSRYILRPPIAQARLQRTGDGCVLVALKSAWSDGTPTSCSNPRSSWSGWRSTMSAAAPVRPENPARASLLTAAPEAEEVPGDGGSPQSPASTEAGRARHWTWANLMRRAFDIDVLACPRCGGRMTLLAMIEDPHVIRRILSHLRLPTEMPQPHASRPPPSPDLFGETPA
jgi:hypothetical protein